jgi:aerobic C4-dicarboxylate transport protein
VVADNDVSKRRVQARRVPIYRQLYFWVLIAIALGAVFGVVAPDQAADMKWLSDLFIKLITVVIAPTIFCTIVVGITGLGNLAKAGGLVLRALAYFLAMTLLALTIGLVVVNTFKPGAGLNLALDPADAKGTLEAAHEVEGTGVTAFLSSFVPDSFLSAFIDGHLIQVIVLAVLVAVAVSAMGPAGHRVVSALDTTSKVMFGLIRVVMYFAPVGAFGGMAFTVGRYGEQVLGRLALFMVTFYLTCVIFVLVVLGAVCWVSGFNVVKFIRLIKDELVIAFGACSSESVLPRMLVKLEAAGAQKSVVGLTIPTGYSFNLDGTCIYLTMGAMFIAQATGTPLTLGQQLGLLAFMLISSKGAAGVTGAGLVTLAASLQAYGDLIPIAGIALIVGIDRFMAEARAVINLTGNGIATMVIARWQGALDRERFRQVLDNPRLIDTEALLQGRADSPAEKIDDSAAVAVSAERPR